MALVWEADDVVVLLPCGSGQALFRIPPGFGGRS